MRRSQRPGSDGPGAPAPGTATHATHATHASAAAADPASARRSFGHVLAVGATGMLRPACVALARDASALTAVARTARSLARLGDELAGTVVAYRAVPLDHRRTDALRSAVRDAIEAHGPASLILAWVHADSPAAPLALAREAAEASDLVRFVHVLGSAAGDPEADLETLATPFHAVPGLQYQQVVLGFEAEGVGPDRRSRWLRDAEISSGVLAAIASRSPLHVVGRIRPWSDRP